MLTNFITPPDIVESILIIDATEEEIKTCAERCRNSEYAYNVYVYDKNMDNQTWLHQVQAISPVVLAKAGNDTGITATHLFGTDQDFSEPAEYFR